jgi:hypothetical protein
MTLGMKQIMVEVPDCITEEKAQYEINRIFSPDWISLHWHISDVQECAGDAPMSDEDAQGILAELKYRHDCNNGVSWDTINHHVDIWRERLEEENG